MTHSNFCPKAEKPRQDAGDRSTLAQFRDDEEGSFVLFGLYLLILMVLVGGLAVDIMRHDYSRLQMQGTLDSAILAAADLDQKLDPESVVRDYFDKAGVLQHLNSVTVQEDVNSRVVTADASMNVNTMFIRSLGIDAMGAAAGGTAREDINEIEVSLVLDFSGSMANYSRIDNLKDAATSFVNTLIPPTGPRSSIVDEVSISIVPYSTQVAVPDLVMDEMTLTSGLTHSNSNCIDFRSSDFSNRSLPYNGTRDQTAHFDKFSSRRWNITPGYVDGNIICRNDDGAEATIMSQSRTDLLEHIEALSPGGNTSADLGLKWGMGFLNPSFRSVTQNLADAGMVDDAFRDRPFDFNRNNSLKVVVLMTDGNNTTQYRMKDAYNGDNLSDIWVYRTNGVDYYSVADDERNDRDNDGDYSEAYFLPTWEVWWDNPYGGNDARRLTWREVWERMTVNRHADEFRLDQYDNWDDYYDWTGDIMFADSPATKDSRMSSMCDAIKAKNVVIFTVGLEVTDANSVKLTNCASSANNYFPVEGQEIVYAFTAIASTINQLRLTQ